ncbi:MAG TPA: DNA damage-inducible protein D [Caulobacteraceae bacterium]|nr:DNA damage-inducible protein D [Caulobacteraceae bacterium]
MAVPTDPSMRALHSACHLSAKGVEYWNARQLQGILGYDTWENFEHAIQRAQDACVSVGEAVGHHFLETTEMVEIGSGAMRERRDLILSRYACYLVAMNGDPRKSEIATAQTYFAIQTRRMELEDARDDADAEAKERLRLRTKVSQSHKRVSGAAKAAGVRSHMQGVFHDARSRGLYGMSLADVKKTKGLEDKDNLFDRADPLELSANDFQMNLAADVIETEQVRGEKQAIETNLSVAKRVRRTIVESGARTPEQLPLASEPIASVRKRLSPPKIHGKPKALGK